MEFKEKLQIMRTGMRLSQEELAAQLNLSRQSVTKWENGQSFPDIQNLIQLSDLFKIPIDRLVKNNDTCNISIFGDHTYSKKDIRIFLVKAKNSTYITGHNSIHSSRLNSHDYRYTEGDYTYMDTYLGNEHFAGEEAVWINDTPVFTMNYYGQVLSSNFNSAFLKEALSHVTPERPYRGLEFYQNGDFTYHCQVNGDIDWFYGEEEIYCKQEKVYMGMFHGGSIS